MSQCLDDDDQDNCEFLSLKPEGQRYLCHVTAHLFCEDLSKIEKIILGTDTLPPDRYYIRKAFCILTSRIPASYELNKINIFLKEACLNAQMYKQFESYVSHIVFQMPLPERSDFFTLRVYLPESREARNRDTVQ